MTMCQYYNFFCVDDEPTMLLSILIGALVVVAIVVTFITAREGEYIPSAVLVGVAIAFFTGLVLFLVISLAEAYYHYTAIMASATALVTIIIAAAFIGKISGEYGRKSNSKNS